MQLLVFSFVKYNGSFVLITLSKRPSVLISIFLFLSPFFIKWANYALRSMLFSLTIFIPKNKPEPLTFSIQSYFFVVLIEIIYNNHPQLLYFLVIYLLL